MIITDLGDPVDRILSYEALNRLPTVVGAIVVVDEESGVLAYELAQLVGPGRVRRFHDSLLAEREATRFLQQRSVDLKPASALDGEVLAGAGLVVMRLPKSLAALDDTAAAVATYATPEVVVLAGGRTRHMTHSMNDVLRRHFASVAGSLGRQKCRVLFADTPTGGVIDEPERVEHPDLGLTVCAYGGVFGGTAIDLGSRLMIGQFDQLPPAARLAVDLGCGNGVLSVALIRALPDVTVLAVDESRTAIRSTEATVVANDCRDRVQTRLADGLESVEDGSVDLIVCNPPFHRGTAKDTATAYAMIDAAGRCLRPGGELWTVYNAHLPYLRALRRAVGPTTVLVQDPRYMVSRSVRQA
jgi:16S rRNA (guanine1207-N2)-methyltransferase